jgi:hypothetical protein
MTPLRSYKTLRGPQAIPESLGGSHGLNNSKKLGFSMVSVRNSMSIATQMASSREILHNILQFEDF